MEPCDSVKVLLWFLLFPCCCIVTVCAVRFRSCVSQLPITLPNFTTYPADINSRDFAANLNVAEDIVEYPPGATTLSRWQAAAECSNARCRAFLYPAFAFHLQATSSART